MKFTLDKNALLKNLQLLSKAIPSRSTLPIIGSALFTVKGGVLSVLFNKINLVRVLIHDNVESLL